MIKRVYLILPILLIAVNICYGQTTTKVRSSQQRTPRYSSKKVSKTNSYEQTLQRNISNLQNEAQKLQAKAKKLNTVAERCTIYAKRLKKEMKRLKRNPDQLQNAKNTISSLNEEEMLRLQELMDKKDQMEKTFSNILKVFQNT